MSYCKPDWSRRVLLERGLQLAGALASTSCVGAAIGPDSATALDAAQVEDLVAANRILVNHEILDALGHVSVRDRRSANRFLLSRSRAPKLVSPTDIEAYDLGGQPIRDNQHPMYLERFIHGAIYARRPEVQAIVHNHAPALIAFGVTGVAVRPVSHTAAFIASGVPLFEIRDSAGMSDLLVRNEERGRALATALADKNAILMRGHGAVVVGPSLPLAVRRSIHLALNARLQLEAMSLSEQVNYLDSQEAAEIMKDEEAGLQRSWELWKMEAAKLD